MPRRTGMSAVILLIFDREANPGPASAADFLQPEPEDGVAIEEAHGAPGRELDLGPPRPFHASPAGCTGFHSTGGVRGDRGPADLTHKRRPTLGARDSGSTVDGPPLGSSPPPTARFDLEARGEGAGRGGGPPGVRRRL